MYVLDKKTGKPYMVWLLGKGWVCWGE